MITSCWASSEALGAASAVPDRAIQASKPGTFPIERFIVGSLTSSSRRFPLPQGQPVLNLLFMIVDTGQVFNWPRDAFISKVHSQPDCAIVNPHGKIRREKWLVKVG